MDRREKKSSITDVTNGNVSTSQSLDQLSSISTMTSHDPTEDTNCQPHQPDLKDLCSFTTTGTLKASITGFGVREKGDKFSRSLSRSRSMRNLHQNPDLSSSSPLLLTLEQRKVQLPHKSSQNKRSTSISTPSIPRALALASAELESLSKKSSPMIFQKDDRLSAAVIGKDTETVTGSLKATKTIFVPTEIETDTASCPPDDLCKNVYRSYEMQLPDSFPVGHVLSNHISNNQAEIKDTYNYEVFTCSPLQDPPRLPNAMESFVIVERSKEEKNNWGWYT